MLTFSRLIARRVLPVLLGVAAACTGTRVDPVGRPCGEGKPCGPGTGCHPTLKICVVQGGDVAVDRARGADRGREAGRDATGDRRGGDRGREAGGDASVDRPGADRAPLADGDGDKVPDTVDNCPTVPNPTQTDMDQDKAGDACDDDIDGDALPNAVDPFPTSKDVVYYYKTANLLPADATVFGTWTAQGTTLCQNDYSDAFQVYLNSSFMPGGDYLIESQLTVLATDPSLPATEGAGVGFDFRVTGAGNSYGYDCGVDLLTYNLLIGKWDPSDWNVIGANSPQSAPNTGPYRLRATAKGSSLTCALVGSTKPPAQVTDSAYPSGKLGLFTYHVKACFDYLLVIKAP